MVAQWADFKDTCKRAFRIVRENAPLLINLLNMMLSTGIPELQSHKDVSYLREVLFLDLDEDQAISKFEYEVCPPPAHVVGHVCRSRTQSRTRTP